MKYHEQELRASDGVKLYVRTADLGGEEVAEVVLTHGRGEHSGRYGHVAEALAGRGLRLWKYDLRGHGRSGGRRGDVPSYDSLLDDLDEVVKLARKSGRPVYLLGHSLGGQITLNYLIGRDHRCSGAVVASPYLRLAFVPQWWRLLLAHAARWVWPSLTQPTPLPWTRLSRDQAHMASFPDLDLMHHMISARMYHAVRDGALDAIAGASRLELPIFLLHGGDDPVTSMEATREFFEQVRSPDKTFKVYPGCFTKPTMKLGASWCLPILRDGLTRARGIARGSRRAPAQMATGRR